MKEIMTSPPKLMTDLSHIQLWDKCRQVIRDIIPSEQFDVWFKDITSVQFDNETLTLQVPSSYFVEQLEERYIKVLGAAIHKVYGDRVQLYYRYDQVKGREDTAVNMLSTNPSGTILDQQKAQPANPFQAKPNIDIDPQLNPRYTFANYCEGESNKIARSIASAIAENPKNMTFNPLFVFGPTGVGKTHLIQAIGVRIKEKVPSARVLYVTSRLFESQYTAAVASKKTNDFFHFYQSIDTLIIDDVQDLSGKPGTQNTFFHIFNQLHQNNKRIIMSSDCAPSELEGIEERLLSRFKWGMSAELTLPDATLRRKVLKLKSEQNGLDIPDEIIDYIAGSVTNSIRDLEGIIVSLIAHATVLSSDITIELAKTVIDHAVKVNQKPINFEVILDKVCSYYEIEPDLLFTKSRKREVSDARQVVMFMAKKLAKMSFVAIGSKLGRTHATIVYACNAIEERLTIDKKLANDIETIRTSIIEVA